MTEEEIKNLKAQNPILDIVTKLGFKIRKQSGTTAIPCIFHSPDKHPSLVLMVEVNRFECKSCGAKGDGIDLVQKYLDLDFPGAVEWLGGQPHPQSVKIKNDLRLAYSSDTNDSYTRETYFADHGISQEMQDRFNLHLGSFKGISTAVIPNDKGKHHRCFSGENKFLTEGKVTLFKAGEYQKDSKTILLAEGELKAILIYQETGYPCWSGTGGCQTFKDEWISEFARAERIYVVYDNDKSGQDSAVSVTKKLGVDRCYLVQIPKEGGKDITDYFLSGKIKEDFEKLLTEATQVSKSNESVYSVEISWPSPLAERAFYGLAGKFIKTIEPHTEADPAALLLNFLIAFGSIVGDKPHIKIGATRHPVRLFAVFVGKTAKGRKGESWGYPKEIFGVIDDLWKRNLSSGMSSGEGLIYAVRDKTYKSQPIREKGKTIGYEQVVDDVGVEDKRLLVVEEEFAAILRRLGGWEGNTLSAIIRSAWDTGDLKTLTKNSPTKATGAHISILGHITRDELLRYLTFTETANGFGNRFLWFCVNRSKSLPFGGELLESDLSFLVHQIKEAVAFAKQTNTIKWAEETRPLWEEIYSDLSEGKPGMIGAMISRAEAIVVRLACIYALLDKSTFIKPPHLLAAIAVWDYAEHSVNYIFQNNTGDPFANKILDALANDPVGMTRTKISKYFGGNASSERILGALEVLEKLGHIRKESNPTGGRNEERWFLNNKQA